MSPNQTKYPELISAYTTPQATEDGILFSIEELNPEWKGRSLITHSTVSLLKTHGYFTQEGEINIPNILDLRAQALHHLKRMTLGFTEIPDHHYAFPIETPHGEKVTIWANMNELQTNEAPHYTLLLPDDR